MANQVIVTNTGNVQVALTPPANVQVQISRAAIGTVSNVPTANFANYAANVTASNQPNITSVGILANLTSSGTATFDDVVVLGNLQVGNLVSNTANYANFAGIAFNVAVANVVGIGNIAVINLDGNVSNVLHGDGSFGAESGNLNANYANFAGQVVDNTQSNITSLGTLTSLSVSGNITGANANLGNLVTANFFSGDGSLLSNINGSNVSNVANANYANFAGTAYSVSGANVSGEVANANYASYSGNANIANLATYATTANSVAGANVSGTVANATFALDAGNANLANLATYATTANSVAGANVSGTVANATFALDAGNSNLANTANSVALANVVGIGNIANINLDGSSSNVLFGNGVFAPESTSIANANYANFAGQVVDNTQSNITTLGTLTNVSVAGNVFAPAIVQNASSYDTRVSLSSAAGIVEITSAGNSTKFGPSGTVELGGAAQVIGGTFGGSGITLGASQTDIFQNRSGNVTVQVGNSGTISSIWNFNNDGNLVLPANAFAVKYANGTQVNLDGPVANANYANFAGTAFSVSGSNVSGEVANANYSSYANIAATANSVAVANVSGIGNIAVINLDGSSSNVLFGNGVFAPESTSIANANYANFAGTVITNAQPNITSLGNLPYLQVSNSANSIGVITQLSSDNITFASNFTNVATYQLTTLFHPNNSTGYPVERVVRSRGNVTTPTTAATGDRIYQKAGFVYNGTTNLFTVSETFTSVGAVNANANTAWSGGQWNVLTGNPSGDVANATALSPQNSLGFNNSGGLLITPGTPANTSLGQSSSSLIVTNYGATTANLIQAGGMTFQRARGNRDSVTNVLAGDQVSRSIFYCYSNGAYQSSNVAQYNVTVDSSYANNDTVVPMSHNFVAISNVGGVATFRTTRFYGNGLTALPGNINFTASTANLFTGSSGQVALGIGAGLTSQNIKGIAIGSSAGTNAQGQYAVAIGDSAGSNNQGQYAVAIGGNAGAILQNDFSIAIGQLAGNSSQGTQSLAVGFRAGQTNQGSYALAFGDNAGANAQSQYTIAIGQYAGANLQGNNSVAFGTNAGKESQGNVAVAIGSGAATTNQGERSVAIGSEAGSNAQGAYSVALGYAAGVTSQANNSIILNASGSTLNQTVANTLTVAPVRNDVSNIGQVMFYNTSSKEVTYGNTISVSGSITSGNATVGTNGSGNIAIFNLYGDKTYNSNFTLNGAQFVAVVDGINPFSGFSPFKFDTYDNSNNYIPPSRYFRARGSVASPASAQAGDNIAINSYAVYADSGNTYKDLFNTTVAVISNDNAGNVVGSYNIINYGGANSYVNINVPTTYAQNLIANANVTAANVQVNTNGFMKLASYTEAALGAITGQIGWMAAVSDSAQGSNPNGMIAFWDTTNTRWSYIHDNSAV